jgi:hypothetical protein
MWCILKKFWLPIWIFHKAIQSLWTIFRASIGYVLNLLHLLLSSASEELDGVDWDWEQPSQASEFGNYVKLLHEASEVLTPVAISMSVNTHPGQFLPPSIATYVERVHLLESLKREVRCLLVQVST